MTALGQRDIHSLYHRDRNCLHGQESEKTFYMHHSAEKEYHIDYHFAGSKVPARPFEMTIGTHEAWSKLSDHVPLITDIAIED